MEKTLKNVLAAVGTVAVVKAAPVLALGAAIGAAVSNPDKVREAAEGLADRVEEAVLKVEDMLYEYGVLAEEDPECCNGDSCTCGEEEAHCGTEEEDAANMPWEDDVPEADAEKVPVTEKDPETAAAKNPQREKLEKLLEVLLDLAEE